MHLGHWFGMPLGYKTDHERSRVRKVIRNGVGVIKVIGLDGLLRMSMNTQLIGFQ